MRITNGELKRRLEYLADHPGLMYNSDVAILLGELFERIKVLEEMYENHFNDE